MIGKCLLSLLLTLTILLSQTGTIHVLDAEAITVQYFCGKEAHSHTEECYQNLLLCGIPDDVHEHTDDCYMLFPVCDFEEHTHDDTCITATDATIQDNQQDDDANSQASDSADEQTADEQTDDEQTADEQTADEQTDDEQIADENADMPEEVIPDEEQHEEDGDTSNADASADDVLADVNDSISTYAATAFDQYADRKIYYRINGKGEYVQSTNGAIAVSVNDRIDLLAVIDNPTMNGNMPDTGASGFLAHPWSQDSGSYIDVPGIAGQWSKVDPTDSNDKRWVAQTTATFKKTGDGKIICLAVNGAVDYDTLTLNIREAPALMHIHNIVVGNMNYDYVDIHTATRMLSGVNSNSESNPYILYVGATLDLSAVTSGTFSIDVNGSIFKELNDDSLDDITSPEDGSGTVGAKTKYLALKPGKGQITFTAEDGSQESIWVQCHYPIYVKTAVRELHKNRVHEYLDIISGRWQKTWLLTDPSGTPIYVRNLGDDPFETRYLMYTDDTVVLIGYALPEDSAQFRIMSAGVEMVEDSLVVETVDRNGLEYQKIRAEFRVTTSGLKEISFGTSDNTETFYINVRNTEDGTIQHCDIEIADAGAYVDTKTEDLGGGKMKITEISYHVEVTGVKQCTVYGKNINPGRFNGAGTDPDVYVIPNNQYGIYGTQTDTQFEFSSAFGITVGPDGKLYSNAALGLVGRSIENIGTITSVVFELYLSLNPNTETVRIIDSDGNDLEKNIYDISDREAIQETRTAVMDNRDILDALNKCPDHSGLDFDVKIASFQADVTLRVQKDFIAGSARRDDTFIFEVYKSNSVLDYDGLKRLTVFDRKSINFKEGGTKEIAFDTLINDEDEEIGPEGKTFHYYIKEFIPDDTGDIVYDETVFRTDITVINDNGSLNMKRANYIWKWKDEEDHTKGGSWEKYSDENYPTFSNRLDFICELPNTGGTGTYLYTVLGILLLSTALILFVYSYCTRKFGGKLHKSSR